MSTIYEGVDPLPPPDAVANKGTWNDEIVVPEDDDDLNAASVVPAFHGLKDCVNWLRHRVESYFNGTWPKLSPIRETLRNNWRLDATAHTGALFSASYSPEAAVIILFTTVAPVLVTKAHTSDSPPISIVSFSDLPIGWSIKKVTIAAQGQSSAGAGTAKYQLICWSEPGTTPEVISNLVSDNHSAGNWNTLKTLDVSAYADVEILSGHRYGVRVTHPNDPIGAVIRIFDFTMSLYGDSIRL